MKARPLLHRLLPLTALLCGPSLALGQDLAVLDGLQLWLEADVGVTTNDAGGVVQWEDQSLNGHLAAQATDALAPTLVEGALNNRPVVRFDGDDDFLEIPDADSLSLPNDMATFYVVKFDDFATYRAVWAKTAGNLPAATDIYAVPNSGVLRAFRGDGTPNNLSSVDTSIPLRPAIYLVLGFDVAGSTLTHYLNNQAIGSGPVTTTVSDGNTPLKIGTRDDFVTRLKGDLAEVLIYDRALSDSERAGVFDYLQTKYDLQNLAPSITLNATPAGPDVSVGDIIQLDAAASDPDGTVSRVEFFADGSLIATASQPPFSVKVAMDSAGAVQFTARAVDDKDGAAESDPVTLNAGPFGPTDLPVTDGLQLWLRADAGTTLGAENAVLQWEDQSGQANTARQAAPLSAPVLVDNAINNLPALRFDGIDDELSVADSDSLSITGDISSFFVVNFADFATYRAVWAKTLDNLPASTDMYALPNNGRLRLYRGNGDAAGIQSVDSAQPYRAGEFMLGEFEQAGPAVSHYLNGVLNGTGNITVPLADNEGPLLIGTRADAVTRMSGDLAELLIYDRALTPAERRSVERYLAEKYALANLTSLANNPPNVRIVSPLGQILQAPGTASIIASADDSDGSVVSVQIFADGVPLGSATGDTANADLNLDYGGAVALSAVAVDNLGGQSSSAPVQLCVQGLGRPAGLVGYWPFDGDATALIGTDGNMVNGAVAAPDHNGISGGALFFDGTQAQRVEIPGGGGLNGASQGSISLWVKWTGMQDTGFGGAAGAVLSRQQDGSFSDDIISLTGADLSNASVQWRKNGAGTIDITGSAVVLNDSWRHIAVTFTATESTLYVDGFPEGSGAGGGGLHDNSATALAIGAWTGAGDSFATAAIDDVAVWNRVLTLEEVQQLAGGLRAPLTLLIAPDCLSIEPTATGFQLRWLSEGILQSTSDLSGTWTDVMDAASPYALPGDVSPVFYRLRSP